MVAKDVWTSQIIDRRYVQSESQQIFTEFVNGIVSKGFTIQGLVLDGRPGFLNAYPTIPTQMCHFHQIQIVTRYLTTRPKSQAGKELRAIALQLTKISEATFVMLLTKWHGYWQEYLKERTYAADATHWEYTHRRLRSAYYSLIRHLPHLFMCKKYPHLRIPNTTNCLDGLFSHLKDSLRAHRGVKQRKKIALIESFLWG